MKPILFILMFLIYSSSSLALEFEQQVTRDLTHANSIQLELGRDVYKSIPYQDDYEVEVPYTVSEPYTDYEDYYESEYICHTVNDSERRCATERECHSVPTERQVCENEQVCQPGRDVRECHQEQVCEPGRTEESCSNERICRPAGPPVCETVQECYTNARGEQQCKERTRCREQQEECHDERVCRPHRGEPVCRYQEKCETRRGEQQCHYENRCRTVRDTREECSEAYRCRDVPTTRQECGFEQVRKTRQVTRYRDVTRTRTETRCCVTRYRDEFDHAWSYNVNLIFPNEATLFGEEIETFEVAIDENEKSPQISFRVVDGIYAYKIKKQSVKGKTIEVELLRVNKYLKDDLGKNSIEDFQVLRNVDGAIISFSDKGIQPRVDSKYSFEIIEKESQRSVHSGTGAAADKKDQFVKTGFILDAAQDYIFKLRVQRSGPLVLERSIDFQIEENSLFPRWNAGDFAEKSIQELSISTKTDSLAIVFRDNGDREGVQTIYQVVALIEDEVFYDQSFDSKNTISSAGVKTFTIPVNEQQQSQKIDIKVKVTRNSRMFDSIVTFELNKAAFFKVDPTTFKDESKINNIFLVEEGGKLLFGFKDQTDEKMSSVDTTYEIKLWIKKGIFAKTKVVFNDTFYRKHLSLSPNKNYLFEMDGAFREDVNPGKKVYYEVRIMREHKSWEKRIEILKSGTLRRP